MYTTILAPNPSLMTGLGTNTILVGDGSEGVNVIDPAVDDDEYLATLIREGEARGGIRRILITHGHNDHLGGAVALRQRLHVPVLAYSQEGAACADEYIADGQRFSVGDDTLCAIYTPGHRFDHLCFLLERQRILFAGDLLGGNTTVVIAPPDGDMMQYLQSLALIQQYDLLQIIPGHGPVITDPQEKVRKYIEHRLLREQQILAVLQNASDGMAITFLVQQMYRGVDVRLHAWAARSVEAHLLKLRQEQRVWCDQSGNWHLSD
ncbi:MAG TPA: MBL fold metallo-hydrolase [Dictyobacter sp.]|jgi:glyoxylase-like metal-dependent hydrolase (beta-lactamase superfamily II)|nr:MBL fold metallo-hydrolase [Dictyobacter sp.]